MSVASLIVGINLKLREKKKAVAVPPSDAYSFNFSPMWKAVVQVRGWSSEERKMIVWFWITFRLWRGVL